MKVNSIDLFKDAQERKYAIPSTNFIDLDTARTYVDTAEELNMPLFLSFAQSHSHIISIEEAAAIGNLLANSSKVPIVLHLDHGEDFEFIKRAISLGFSSVMIDASMKSFEDNISITKKVVDYAHDHNVTVEAELGHVGSNDYGESDTLTESVYTEVEDVIEFVKKTNVDSLAISIGTAHGVYKGEPNINFDRLEQIRKLTDIPLVLHGGSSSGDENLNRCAMNGISKINIYTDFLNGAMNQINKDKPSQYVDLKVSATEGIKKILLNYFKVFNTKEVRSK